MKLCGATQMRSDGLPTGVRPRLAANDFYGADPACNSIRRKPEFRSVGARSYSTLYSQVARACCIERVTVPSARTE
jgi:hypothetical protein